MAHQTGAVKTQKHVRRSVTPPEPTARKVASIARRHRLSDNRVLVELIEEGIEARKAKEKMFFEIAERFRASQIPQKPSASEKSWGASNSESNAAN